MTSKEKESLFIGKNKPLIIDLICSLGVNRYNGNEYLQVKIDKFEIENLLEKRYNKYRKIGEFFEKEGE